LKVENEEKFTVEGKLLLFTSLNLRNQYYCYY